MVPQLTNKKSFDDALYGRGQGQAIARDHGTASNRVGWTLHPQSDKGITQTPAPKRKPAPKYGF